MVEVPSVGGRAPRQLSRQILCDILQPRAEEVLMHVSDEIRDAGWNRQLSSGVVLTGGGALLDGMVEIAEQVFDAPVRVGYPGEIVSADWSKTFRVLRGQRLPDSLWFRNVLMRWSIARAQRNVAAADA
jgi:cell division ATPase FtsA